MKKYMQLPHRFTFGIKHAQELMSHRIHVLINNRHESYGLFRRICTISFADVIQPTCSVEKELMWIIIWSCVLMRHRWSEFPHNFSLTNNIEAIIIAEP